MGNTSSAIGTALKQFEADFCGKVVCADWSDKLRQLCGLLPFWAPGQEFKQRFVIPGFKAVKALEVIFSLLSTELHGVNLNSREFAFDNDRACLLLESLEKLLTVKALYKNIPKVDLSPVVTLVRVCVRSRNHRVLLHALGVVRMIVERVGFVEEKDSSKEHNQVKREAAAKAHFIAAGGVDALVEGLATFHARYHPVVVDATARLLLSFLCVHQDTTPFDVLQWILVALEPLHALIWEWSRSDYARLRVSACALMRGIFLESDVKQAHPIQQTALEWGALLWHLRYALLPAEDDAAFSNSGERDCEPAAGNDLVACIDSWPATKISSVWHNLAREASREMIALLCMRNRQTVGVVQRALPIGLRERMDAVDEAVLPTLKDPLPLDMATFISPASRQCQEADGSVASPCKIPDLLAEGSQLPVAVGSQGFLWWDVSLCAAPRTTLQKNVQSSKVKLLWCGVVPAPSNIEHAVDDSLTAAVSTASVPVTVDVPLQTSTSRPEKVTAERKGRRRKRTVANPGRWTLQTAEKNWPAIFGILTSREIVGLTFVWTQQCLHLLREALWVQQACLDASRRLHKLHVADAGNPSSVVSSAISIVGAKSNKETKIIDGADVGTKPGWCIMAASNVWYGSEKIDLGDSNISIPDVRGVPIDRIKNPQGILSFPVCPTSWQFDAFEVVYVPLHDLLCVNGVYIAQLLRLLRGEAIEHLAFRSPALPPAFPTLLSAAWQQECDPRRKFALLHCLRLLTQSCIGEFSGSTSLDSQLRVTYRPNSVLCASLKLGQDAFESPLIVTALADVICHVNAGLQDVDVGPNLPGCDAAFAAALGTSAPYTVRHSEDSAAVEINPTAHFNVPSLMNAGSYSSSTAFSGLTYVRQLSVSGTSDGRPAGESAHWLYLWRQESVLALRYLLPLPTCARVFLQFPWLFLSLAPLLCLPHDADDMTALVECTDVDVVNKHLFEGTRWDDAPAVLRNAWRKSDADHAESIECVCRDFCPVLGTCAADGTTRPPVDSRDTFKGTENPFVAEVVGSSANPFAPSKPLFAEVTGPGGSHLMLMAGELLHDPDVTLVLDQRHLSRTTIARAAAESFMLASTSWKPFAQGFARDDLLLYLVRSLLQAPKHRQVTELVLQVVQQITLNVPWVVPAFACVGMYEALLLAGIQAPTPSSEHPDIILSSSVATTLYLAHMVHADNHLFGWLERGKASQRTLERMHVPATADAAQQSFSGWFSTAAKNAVSAKVPSSASSLANLLPEPLVSCLRKEGADKFAEVFNADLTVTASLMWSSELRNIVTTELRERVSKLQKAHLRERSPLVGAPYLLPYCLRAASSVRQVFSGGHVPRIPSSEELPSKQKIAFSPLDDEPQICGVYLRALLSSTDIALPVSMQEFCRTAMNLIHAEVCDFLKVHYQLRRMAITPQAEADSAALSRAYRRHHYRVLLFFRSLRKLIIEVPGMKCDSGMFHVLSVLLSVPLGLYPRGVIEGLPTAECVPLNISSCAAVAALHAIQPLSALDWLLPLDAINDADPDAATRDAVVPSPPVNSSVKSSAHAQAVRELLTGRQRMSAIQVAAVGKVQLSPATVPAADVASELPGSASTGFVVCGDSVSLVTLVLEFGLNAIKPNTQAEASRKTVQLSLDAKFLQRCLALVSWCTSAPSAVKASFLHTFVPQPLAALASGAREAKALVTQPRFAASDSLRAFVGAPLAVASLRLVSWICTTDPGTNCFISDASLLTPLVETARATWRTGFIGVSPEKSATLPWIPTELALQSAMFRVTAASVTTLNVLAVPFAVRSTLVSSGCVLALLYTAIAGDDAVAAGGSSNQAATASVGIGADAVTRVREKYTPSQDVESRAVNIELLGDSTSALGAHVLSLWDLRRSAENALKVIVDKVGPTSDEDTNELSIADIAGSAADAMSDGTARGSMGGRGSMHVSAAQGPPIRKASMRNFKAAATVVVSSLNMQRLSTAPSFAASMAEQSVRCSPPSDEAILAINGCITLLKNLLTPGVFNLLSPSLIDMLTKSPDANPQELFDTLCSGLQSMLPVVRSHEPVHHTSLTWSTTHRYVLETVLLNELNGVDKVVAERSYTELLQTGDAEMLAPSSSGSSSNPLGKPTPANPFASAPTSQTASAPPNPFAAAMATKSNPFASVVSRAVTASKGLWNNPELLAPATFKTLFPDAED